MSDYMKLSLLNIKTLSEPTEDIVYVRSTEIAAMASDPDGTLMFAKGVEQPFRVKQTPDEILAMMKDDNASLPMRHILEHQMMDASKSA